MRAAVAVTLLAALITLVGWPRQKPTAFRGYTLSAPLLSTTTELIDMEGRPVKAWESQYTAGHAAYLLENGHLLRAGQLPPDERLFSFPQAGGRIQEFTWDGELIWDFTFHNQKQVPHHDLAPLPNGNVLLIVWEIKTALETIAAGRSQDLVEGPWLVDSVVEIRPTGKTTGEVVWEWHVWDHLIAAHDSAGGSRRDVAAHPELIDVNFGQTLVAELSRDTNSPASEAKRQSHLNALKSIGYLGSPATRGNTTVLPDWTHINAISYNPGLDQIMLTVRAFSEIWIIDHSTTSAEAKGHSGGSSAMGGDLLYRWGNPQAYRAGKRQDRQLFAPHGAHWIPPGCPGAGHALVFNNGLGRPGDDYSSVDEIALPVDAAGRYARRQGSAYGPEKPIWTYTGAEKTGFFARLLSSAQRLPNGNTLICHGEIGAMFEVTPNHQIVWEHKPERRSTSPPVPPARDQAGFTAEHPLVEVLSAAVRDALELSPPQRKAIDELQTEVDLEIGKTLSDEQRERLRQPSGLGGLPAPGQLMSLSRQVPLKPTDDQKKQLAGLQGRVDDRLALALTADQKARLEALKRDFARGGPMASGNSGPPRGQAGRPTGLGPDVPPPLPPGVNPMFHAVRYGANHPGLADKSLRPSP
jgi:hypothetical protein